MIYHLYRPEDGYYTYKIMAEETKNDRTFDEMDILTASMWLEERNIPYEHLVSLEELKLRIKRQIEQDRESANNKDTGSTGPEVSFSCLETFPVS